MTSNPKLDDVIVEDDSVSSIGGSRKPSRITAGGDDDDNAELIYSKNGTGLQRKASKGKLKIFFDNKLYILIPLYL